MNSIAIGVRSDARQYLRRRLDGLQWEWVPYVPSGLPLAGAVERVVRNSPWTDVIVLGNHGLIVCGNDCGRVEELLDEVEARLTLHIRRAPDFDQNFLRRLTQNSGGDYRSTQRSTLSERMQSLKRSFQEEFSIPARLFFWARPSHISTSTRAFILRPARN